jgi:hypothetical protein
MKYSLISAYTLYTSQLLHDPFMALAKFQVTIFWCPTNYNIFFCPIFIFTIFFFRLAADS